MWLKLNRFTYKFLLKKIKASFNILSERNSNVNVNKGKPGKDKAMNEDIKSLFKEAHVPQWKVAAYLGVSEGTFCRKLRKEIDLETRLRIFEAVDALGKEEA